MLNALSLDPATTQKRLGDGFYEQRLITEQVAQLTGRRFLAGYADDETQYRALLDAGVTLAREWQLVPGVALSEAQMAQLTSDIVWLVQQTVTLADGRQQTVLVPQLYVRVREGDLQSSGALIAGDTLQLNVRDELINRGTLAGRSLVNLSADTLQNLGGRILGKDVLAQTRSDLINLGGSFAAGRSLTLQAGGNLQMESTVRTSTSAQGSRTQIDRLATLYVGQADGSEGSGQLLALAGGDARFTATRIDSGGSVTLAAGNNLHLATVQEASDQQIVWNSKNRRSDTRQQEVGTLIQSQGDLTLIAGQDLTARAASVSSTQGALTANAGQDLTIEAGQARLAFDDAHQQKSKGLLSRKTKTTRDTLDQTTAIASTFSGETVTLQAGNDMRIQGSNVVSTANTTLLAQNHLSIEAATETHRESHFKKTTQSGVFGSGGVGFTIGSRMQSTDRQSTATGAAKSTVGSVAGNVTLLAGKQYKQVGSEVIAPQGNIAIAAHNIAIEEARETSRSVTEQKFKQSGLTVAFSNPVVSAVQTAQQMATAARNTSDPRMQALAAANTALSAKNAADAVKAGQGVTTPDGKTNQLPVYNDKGEVTGTRDANAADQVGGINISISLGTSKSSSKTIQTSDTAAASTLSASGDLTLTATGAVQDSDITVQGSALSAGKQLKLQAEDEIRLLAAQNTSTQAGQRKNSSASVGIGFSLGGSQNGFTLQAGASSGKGKTDGKDLFWSNTQLNAGNTLTLQSGGDTTLKGAVASAPQVIAKVGGHLAIESLQDLSTYRSKDQSAGFSMSLCIPPLCAGAAPVSGSVSASQSKV